MAIKLPEIELEQPLMEDGYAGFRKKKANKFLTSIKMKLIIGFMALALFIAVWKIRRHRHKHHGK